LNNERPSDRESDDDFERLRLLGMIRTRAHQPYRVRQSKNFRFTVAPVPAILIALFVSVWTGCHGFDGLHNAETLRRLGFSELGHGFFYKPGMFLVKLDDSGTVSKIITARDTLSGKMHDRGVEHEYRTLAIIDNRASNAGKSLALVSDDGSCTEMGFDGNLRGTCDDSGKAVAFTPEEAASGAPLKKRLEDVAHALTSGVYTIADPGDSHEDFFAVYRNEKLAFAGNAQPGRLSKKTRILGFHMGKQEFRDDEIGALDLAGENIRYDFGANGYLVTGSAKQLKEIAPDLSPGQRYTETETSGFRIGGVNRQEIIGKMTTLTGKTIEEIESDARPGSLSQAGFLGEDEKFKERLKADNAFVRGKGFTHPQLAEPLFSVMNILDAIGDSRFDDFTYRGHHYKAEYRAYRGFQTSLFNDGLQVDRDFTVTNLNTGEELAFSPLLPYYIARYGFYEGHTSYRADPAKIIEVFQLSPGRD
jgi:hypothetical protein